MLDRGENASHVARVMRVGRSTLYRALTTPLNGSRASN